MKIWHSNWTHFCVRRPKEKIKCKKPQLLMEKHQRPCCRVLKKLQMITYRDPWFANLTRTTIIKTTALCIHCSFKSKSHLHQETDWLRLMKRMEALQKEVSSLELLGNSCCQRLGKSILEQSICAKILRRHEKRSPTSRKRSIYRGRKMWIMTLNRASEVVSLKDFHE